LGSRVTSFRIVTFTKRVTVCIPFTDGIVLDVYEDAEGRQYVLEPDGEKCY
jgi:hypothetical protein